MQCGPVAARGCSARCRGRQIVFRGSCRRREHRCIVSFVGAGLLIMLIGISCRRRLPRRRREGLQHETGVGKVPPPLWPLFLQRWRRRSQRYFALSLPLTTERDGLDALEILRGAYRAAQTRSLTDMRILNARGEALPIRFLTCAARAECATLQRSILISPPCRVPRKRATRCYVCMR